MITIKIVYSFFQILAVYTVIIVRQYPGHGTRKYVSTKRVRHCIDDDYCNTNLMTLPSVDKLWLIADPSFNLSPVAPVESALSDPARSTRLISLLLVLL